MGMKQKLHARLGGRGARTASLCLALAMVVSPAFAEASGARAPRRLIDGSAPQTVPNALRAQPGPLVMTRLRISKVSKLRKLVTSCVPGDRIPGGRLVVERIGVNGRDITFLGLYSNVADCDRNPRANGKPWCGGAGWPFRSGRVSDARLAICQDPRGKAVAAFAWINPLRYAKWVIVDQSAFREVYPVGGHLPVRVTTVSGFGRKGVAFHYAQYDERGVLLARKTLITAIAS
jgi:hypothetical protein